MRTHKSTKIACNDIRSTFILAASVLLSVMFLPSCKKNKATKNNSPDHGYTTINMSTVSAQEFEINNMSWEDLLVGTDQTDVGYRKAQLYLSRSLAEVVKDPVIAHWITTQTKAANDNVISFDDLFGQFPETKQIVESIIDPAGEINNWTYEQVAELMQYDTFIIKPSIFLANAGIADEAYKPISTTGYDLDLGENDTHPSDVVMGWHLDNNNSITRVNIWEEVAQAQAAPILAIDGRATNLGTLSRTLEDEPNAGSSFPPSDHPNMRVSVVKYRINFRYDVSRKSELQIAGACSWKGGAVRTFLKHSCFTGDMWDKPLRDIHKNQIGTWWLNQDSYFCRHHSPYPTGFSYGEYDHNYPSGVFDSRKLLTYNTFERDWFASRKPLSPTNIYLTSAPSILIPIGLTGNMSKYDEWYLFPPSWGSYATLSASPILILPYPYIGWTHDKSSGKGDLGLKTLNHCNY